MPIVRASGKGFVVRVSSQDSVAVIQRDTRGITVSDRAALSQVRERSRTVQVGAPGPAGRDGAPGGTSEQRIADGALGGHRVVRTTSGGKVGYADSAIVAHGDDIIGLTLAAANDGDAVAVQRAGPVTFNGWAWDIGAPVYAGGNGLPTQDVPDDAAGAAFVKVIGHAETATTLYLQLEPATFF